MEDPTEIWPLWEERPKNKQVPEVTGRHVTCFLPACWISQRSEIAYVLISGGKIVLVLFLAFKIIQE